MKPWMIGLLMTALVLSYQNCGAPSEMVGSYGGNSLKSAVDRGGSAETASWTGVEFENQKPESYRPERFHVDLETGEIIRLGEEQAAAEPLCLTEDELEEIRSILETSKVCEPVQDSNPGRVCTMEYGEAYAWLVSEDQRGEAVLALGEKLNGCHKPIDLCGDHSNLLKGFLANISNSLDGRSCTK